MSQSARRSHSRSAGLVVALSLALVAQIVPSASPVAAAAPGSANAVSGGLRATIHAEEALAHADDVIAFAPGGRVTIGFTPRVGDTWKVGGASPRALPAGRLDGRAMRTDDVPANEHPAAPTPSAPADPPASPTPDPTIAPDPTVTPDPTPSPDPTVRRDRAPTHLIGSG